MVLAARVIVMVLVTVMPLASVTATVVTMSAGLAVQVPPGVMVMVVT